MGLVESATNKERLVFVFLDQLNDASRRGSIRLIRITPVGGSPAQFYSPTSRGTGLFQLLVLIGQLCAGLSLSILACRPVEVALPLLNRYACSTF